MKLIKKIYDNKILKRLYAFVKVIITIFLLMVLFIVVLQRFSNNNITIGGIRIFCVISRSMSPQYEIGDILITKKVPAQSLEVDDVVTYVGNKNDFEGVVITHKIISKTTRDGKYYFITKGIANETSDPEISYDQIYGKVVYKSFFVSAISRLMSNMVAYYIIFTVVGLIVSFQIVRIVFQAREQESDDDEEEEK